MSAYSQGLKHLKDLQHINLEGLRFRLVDAKGQVVGRVAAQIATILQGKDKPTYTPKKNCGDVVIVINAAHVHFTHDSWNLKLYRWHSGWPGGFKQRTAAEMWEKDPTRIIFSAVRGMLPKNKTRMFRLDKLKIFPEDDHPFKDFDLVPFIPPPRQLNLPGLGWPLPEGFQPMNPEKYAFRFKATPELHGKQRPQVDFRDLLSEEERQILKMMPEQLQTGGKQA